MERGERGEAVSHRLPRLRFLLLGAVAVASVATAVAFALGYAWSGAWLRASAIATAALYLPVFYLLAWLLIPSTHRAAVILLWILSGAAIAVWAYAALLPDSFPVKVTALDVVVLVAIPLSAYAYRRLSGTSTA
jgi:uncharacterized membrane protein